MLDRFFATLSRRSLAVGAITIGIILIFLFSPPVTVCDSQYDQFKTKQIGKIFFDPKPKVKPSKTAFHLSVEQCRFSNNVGGCLDFFNHVKSLTNDLDTVSTKCFGDIGSRVELKDALWVSVELMTRLAWGETPPRSYKESSGWLETPNILIYCELKKILVQFYGPEKLNEFARTLIPQLPGGNRMPFSEAWPKTILSMGCR